MRPERLEDLDDVKMWIADHDGRNDAYWTAQHVWNSTKDKEISALGNRVSAIEKRVMWVAGIFSALGAGGGVGIFSLLGG